MEVVNIKDKFFVAEVVDIHMRSFKGFFLTFLGRGFLKQLYAGFVDHPNSGLLIAREDNKVLGFLAYSDDISGFYKYLIKKRLLHFAWYALGAFFRRPKALFRLFRALSYSGEAKRKEAYVELSSIGVSPDIEGKGVGSKLIDALKNEVDFEKYAYIKLETDAVNNEGANYFYRKNGFVMDHSYETPEGRKMNEYRFYGVKTLTRATI